MILEVSLLLNLASITSGGNLKRYGKVLIQIIIIYNWRFAIIKAYVLN